MSTPACGSSLLGRETGRHNCGTQHAVNTLLDTRYHTRGPERESFMRASERENFDDSRWPASPTVASGGFGKDCIVSCQTIADSQQRRPNHSGCSCTSRFVACYCSYPVVFHYSDLFASCYSCPVVTHNSTHWSRDLYTLIMVITRTFEQVSVTGACQMQVAVSGMSTQVTPDEGQSPLDVPLKLLIRGYVHVY